MIAPAVHVAKRSRFSEHQREQAARSVANAAFMVERLMPIIFQGQIIGWCGWSRKEMCAYVLHHKPWMRTWIDRNGLLLGFPSVDAIIAAVTAQQMKQVFWFKTTGTGPSAVTWTHMYGLQGNPGVGLWNGTAYTARRHDDTEIGAMQHGGNVSPKVKQLLSGGFCSNTTTVTDNPVFVLYDMVLSYDQSVVSSTPTTFTNTNTALRYISAGDPGLQIMGAAGSAMTGGINYTSYTYTNIAGTTGRQVPVTLIEPTDTNVPSTTQPADTIFALTNTNQRGLLNAPLITGDGGVTKLEAITMGSTVADKLNHMLCFQLAWVACAFGGEELYPYDWVKVHNAVPVIKDGACLTYAGLISSTVHPWWTHLTVAWS